MSPPVRHCGRVLRVRLAGGFRPLRGARAGRLAARLGQDRGWREAQRDFFRVIGAGAVPLFRCGWAGPDAPLVHRVEGWMPPVQGLVRWLLFVVHRRSILLPDALPVDSRRQFARPIRCTRSLLYRVAQAIRVGVPSECDEGSDVHHAGRDFIG